jgi:hypothetical protein
MSYSQSFQKNQIINYKTNGCFMIIVSSLRILKWLNLQFIEFFFNANNQNWQFFDFEIFKKPKQTIIHKSTYIPNTNVDQQIN